MEGTMTINHFIGRQMEKALAWDAFYAAMSKNEHNDDLVSDQTYQPVAYQASGIVEVMRETLEAVKTEVEAEAHPGLCFLCGGKHTP